MAEKIKVLVVGLGNMGMSHAKAYHALDGFEIVGLCARSLNKNSTLSDGLSTYARFNDYEDALAACVSGQVLIETASGLVAANASS